MLEGSCDCGVVRFTVDAPLEAVTDCNCGICRRYGALWAYYQRPQFRVQGATAVYLRNKHWLEFHRCKECGCVTHWEPIDRTKGRRVGVNARNFDPDDLGRVRIRRLDGASTWKYLD